METINEIGTEIHVNNLVNKIVTQEEDITKTVEFNSFLVGIYDKIKFYQDDQKGSTYITIDEKNKELAFENSKLLRTKKWDYKDYFSKAQKWIGFVENIDNKENIFSAKLEDLNIGGSYEIGEFEIKEISNEDLELFKVGAVFYWSVGYNTKNGQVVKESLIRFQRLPEWSSEEYDESIDRANNWMKDWDNKKL